MKKISLQFKIGKRYEIDYYLIEEQQKWSLNMGKDSHSQ